MTLKGMVLVRVILNERTYEYQLIHDNKDITSLRLKKQLQTLHINSWMVQFRRSIAMLCSCKRLLTVSLYSYSLIVCLLKNSNYLENNTTQLSMKICAALD